MGPAAKRLEFDASFRGPAAIATGFLTAGVPVAALLLCAFLSGGRPTPPAAWAAAIGFGMLLPYVLVNHNERHQLPLVAMQAAALGACAQACAGRWPRKGRRMSRRTVVLVAGILGLYWRMATAHLRHRAAVGDEIAHLTAGYSYWKTGDHRLQPVVTGGLPQRWAHPPLPAPRSQFPTSSTRRPGAPPTSGKWGSGGFSTSATTWRGCCGTAGG